MHTLSASYRKWKRVSGTEEERIRLKFYVIWHEKLYWFTQALRIFSLNLPSYSALYLCSSLNEICQAKRNTAENLINNNSKIDRTKIFSSFALIQGYLHVYLGTVKSKKGSLLLRWFYYEKLLVSHILYLQNIKQEHWISVENEKFVTLLFEVEVKFLDHKPIHLFITGLNLNRYFLSRKFSSKI